MLHWKGSSNNSASPLRPAVNPCSMELVHLVPSPLHASCFQRQILYMLQAHTRHVWNAAVASLRAVCTTG
jgi:hypothetical protein